MPISPIDFPVLSPGSFGSGAFNIARGLSSGVDAYQKAKQDAIANQLKKLQQQKLQQEIEFLPKEKQAEIALKLAQASRQNQLSNMPGGLQHLIGPAAASVSLSKVKQDYGEDSQEYKNAKQYWDVMIGSRQTAGLGTGGKEEFLYLNKVKKANPSFNDDQVYEASNLIRQGKNTFDDGTKINVTPDLQASLDRIAKAGNTSQGLNQQRFANTLETAIDSSGQNAEGAFRFSGLMGKLKLPLEKVASQVGYDNPDYQSYINFTRTDVPTIAGEYMRELGVNASDEQKRMYKEVVNPISWDTDFKTAYARWNYFKSLARKIGKTVAKSPGQTQRELRSRGGQEEQINNSISDNLNKLNNKSAGNPAKVMKSDVTEENISYTMHKTGLSRNEVIKRLKKKGLM